MRFYLFLTLCIVIVSFNACSKPEEVINIDPSFGILLRENLSSPNKEPQLVIFTLDSNKCSNAEIICPITKNGFSTEVNIKGIELTASCDQIECILEKSIPLHPIPNQNIIIKMEGNFANYGVIKSQINHYDIAFDKQIGIQLKHSSFQKVPPQLYWGYLDITLGIFVNVDQIRSTLLSKIKAFGSGDANLTPANYGHFLIDDESKFELLYRDVPNKNNGTSVQFVFKYDCTDEELKTKIQELTSSFSRYNTNIKLKIFTQSGKVFN